MKTNSSIHLLFISILVVAISCTGAEGSSLDNALPAPKEEKEPKIAKAKKKEKKKTVLVAKKKSKKVSSPRNEGVAVNETRPPEPSKEVAASSPMLNILGDKVVDFAAKNDFSVKYCFLIDMSLPSGRKRFFVYDLEDNSVVLSGLVAHGSCNQTFLSRAKFSNAPNCGCSSLGKYKVGELYNGKYGKSFRLYGLDYSNSNAYKRGVVIHGYDCVPDREIAPMVLCNSEGCPMVSYRFFAQLSRIIKQSDKPIVLWIYQ